MGTYIEFNLARGWMAVLSESEIGCVPMKAMWSPNVRVEGFGGRRREGLGAEEEGRMEARLLVVEVIVVSRDSKAM